MLHLAAQTQREDILGFLLQQKIQEASSKAQKDSLAVWVREFNQDNLSCLHYCAFNGLTNTMRLLMEHGFSFEPNSDGLGPVHYAAQGDCITSLVFFRDNKIPLETLDEKGGTPLHWACYSGNDQAAMFLTAWGANPNIRDKLGYTPLHLSALAGNARCVKRLLIKGADRFALDNQGKTAYEYAMERKYDFIADMLVNSPLEQVIRESHFTFDGNSLHFLFLIVKAERLSFLVSAFKHQPQTKTHDWGQELPLHAHGDARFGPFWRICLHSSL